MTLNYFVTDRQIYIKTTQFFTLIFSTEEQENKGQGQQGSGFKDSLYILFCTALGCVDSHISLKE